MGQCGQDARYVLPNILEEMQRDGKHGIGQYSWTNHCTVQCPNEKCRNDEAYWYQLQIRSADEPMTAFYKVSCILCPMK